MSLTKVTKFVKNSEGNPKWYIIDASGVTLGKLAVTIANELRGKISARFTPNSNIGSYIIVNNVEKVHLSGKKLYQKKYYRHSGYPGGLKSRTAHEVLNGKTPEDVIRNAVKGMLPKGPLGYAQLRKLFLYKGSQNPHEAQKPEALSLSGSSGN